MQMKDRKLHFRTHTSNVRLVEKLVALFHLSIDQTAF